MSKQKPWPKNARYARDFAAESLQEIARLSRPLLGSSDKETIIRGGKILAQALDALCYLESIGAPTRPDDK